MGLTARVLSADDIDETFARRWDALSAARPLQADFFDSHVWYASWSEGPGPEVAPSRIRIAAVLDGSRPVAVLPLVQDGSVVRTAGWDRPGRVRSRIAVGTDHPLGEVLDHLARAVTATGARRVALYRLPVRDPATRAFVRALRDNGFAVALRHHGCDMVTPVDGPWASHRERLRGFDGYARRFENRLVASWGVELEVYGGPFGKPLADGLPAYRELHARSWQGVADPRLRHEESDFMRRADRNGWARLFLLRVAGMPVAAQTWVRLGDVAVWRTTAYDRSLPGLGAGTVVQWSAQRQLFAETPPRLLDFIPGITPEKERLATERPQLLDVDAQLGGVLARPVVWGRAGAARAARWLRPRRRAAVRRLHAYRRRVDPRPALGRWGRQVVGRVGAAVPGALLPRPLRRSVGLEGGGPEELTGWQQVALLAGSVDPHGVPGLPAPRPVRPSAPLVRYLALAAGEPGPEAVRRSWGPRDRWLLLGESDAPTAVVRVDGTTVREVVRVAPSLPLAVVARTLRAAGLDGDAATQVRTAPLPWPRNA
ncbi:GNAT family N-acetyltransferase [Allostreptomyces psammosilenae]|uniref:BioF2-like acetyltransferase domain-containing protein n=1 Tax=Allostreptomyces psammosilenae TaxID=1892865 RepID=A0A853AC55_9ACTN|nr:GNAT family N-acetyltransferase [Allostreptomyces psammosilenae]NYI07952.1 hypothetical protein [Allostreptomyces psammosilenae]